METSNEPSRNFESPPKEESFGPPEITDLASLTDGRRVGEFESRYPASVWLQIALELTYLITVLIASFLGLFLLALFVAQKQDHGLVFDVIGPLPKSLPLVVWGSMTLAGACGGCTSSLKWLYHTVAKERWHRDRLVWRVIVPILSAMLAVFSGLMIVSGLVPFLARAPLTMRR